jgi:hypothetical protein
MDESVEDDKEDVEDVPQRQEGLHFPEKLGPQLVSVHQHDWHRQRNQKTWLLRQMEQKHPFNLPHFDILSTFHLPTM